MKPDSLILKSFSKYIFVFINVAAIFIFFKGHNEPGGGFIAGVATAISLVLLEMTQEYSLVKKMLRIDPLTIAGAGLILAYGTSFAPVIVNKPFLYHKMIHLHIPILGDLHVGTPLLFDLGVYLVVVGVLSKMIFVFSEETKAV